MNMRKYVKVEELKAEFPREAEAAIAVGMSLAESMDIRMDQTMFFVLDQDDCTEHMELFADDDDSDTPVRDEFSNVALLREWMVRNDCDVMVCID